MRSVASHCEGHTAAIPRHGPIRLVISSQRAYFVCTFGAVLRARALRRQLTSCRSHSALGVYPEQFAQRGAQLL
jgi:hypothetical protein